MTLKLHGTPLGTGTKDAHFSTPEGRGLVPDLSFELEEGELVGLGGVTEEKEAEEEESEDDEIEYMPPSAFSQL